MSKLPDHPDRGKWHGADGTHLFPHPGQYESRKSLWSAQERRYAAHLDRHKELADNPEPMDDDPDVVTALFAHIDNLQAIIAKEKKLIIALRQRRAMGATIDERAVSDVLRSHGVIDERCI